MRSVNRTISRALALALALLSVGLTACGSASKSVNSTAGASSSTSASGDVSTAESTTSTSAERLKDAPDGDGDGSSDDDNVVLAYGHVANQAETRVVANLVRHYFALAADDDGAAACSQLYLVFRESIPEDYGQPPGPPSLRGKTCAVVMSKLFRERRRQLAAERSTLKVTGVRVEGKQGYALLRFSGQRQPRAIQVHTESGVWRIESLLDVPLP